MMFEFHLYKGLCHIISVKVARLSAKSIPHVSHKLHVLKVIWYYDGMT